jgi:hypothetical protein
LAEDVIMKALRFAPFAFVLVLILGCSSDTEILQPEEPAFFDQSTPENTIKRFVQLYELKKDVEYEKLFTGDFLFEFSNSSDPDLANEYSAGWWQEDEMTAAKNLFRGGVNNDGVYQAAARTVDLDLVQVVPQDDNSEGRDPLTYKVLFTPVTLTVQLPPDEEEPEGATFVVGGADPSVHRFFLVRGDYASGLRDDQPADAKHWYIWLWRDESTVFKSVGAPRSEGQELLVQVEPTTWGRLKGLYR